MSGHVPPPRPSRHDRYMLQLSECKACLSTRIGLEAVQTRRLGHKPGDNDVVSMLATCLVCGYQFDVPTAEEMYR